MSRITTPLHAITLGGLPLVEDGQPYEHAGGFTTEVSADGFTLDNPEIVVAQIISALSEGDLIAGSHVGNREASFRVRIKAKWAGDLAAGEKALAAVVGRAVELVWQPPDPVDPATVFDVLHSRMDFQFDDFDELQRIRTYVLTLTCLPRGRSDTKIVTPALTAAAPTVVDAGSSSTNWTAPTPSGASLSVVSGAITNTYDAGVNLGSGLGGAALRRVANFDVTTQPYLAIDWSSSRASAPLLGMMVDGQSAFFTELRREPVGTFTRSWYAVPDGSTTVNQFSFAVTHGLAASGTSATLKIDQVQKANALPAVGTARQLTRTVAPGGSVTAEGDVIVQHPSAGLGQTIVYSYPSGAGYSPSMRQWLTSSNAPTADATTVSGARQSLATVPSLYDIPVEALPAGDAQLWVRVRLASGSAALTGMNYDVRSVMGGVELENTITVAKFNLPASGSGWSLVPLGRITLPPRNLGLGGKVRIYLLRSTVVDLEIDEAWLFGMDRGRLTVLDCGTGTPSAGTIHNRLRVSAPSLTASFGRVEVATSADWSDAFTPDASEVLCDQTGHRFDPDGSSIFTVTSGTTDAAVSLEHYPRWHSNAGVI